jgi:hypothetical protein
MPFFTVSHKSVLDISTNCATLIQINYPDQLLRFTKSRRVGLERLYYDIDIEQLLELFVELSFIDICMRIYILVQKWGCNI